MPRIKLVRDKAGHRRYADRDTGKFLSKREYQPAVEALRRNAYAGIVKRSATLRRSAQTVALKANVSKAEGRRLVVEWLTDRRKAIKERKAVPGFPTSP